MKTEFYAGAQFPDFELRDHDRNLRKLSEIQEADALIIVTARGYHCRGDRLQQRLLTSFYAELREGFTKIVTVISGNWKSANAFRGRVGAQWPFLYDSRGIVAESLDIADISGRKNNELIPHTFILETGLRIFKIYNGYWYWDRPSIEDLRKDLRTLYRKIRPRPNKYEDDGQSGILV